jgi:lipoprotein-releasing system permease protein
MRWEFYITKRYLAGRRKQVFSFVTTIIAIAGVSIGVATLIVTLAIMDGFHSEIRDKIISLQAHIIILPFTQLPLQEAELIEKELSGISEIVSLAPFTYANALVKYKNFVQGIVVKGILPEKEVRVTNINLVADKKVTIAERLNLNDVIVGEELAKSFGVSIGENVDIISPSGATFSAFSLFPDIKRFKVSGIFRSGMYEYDTSLVYMHLLTSQNLFNLGDKISGLSVKVKNIYHVNDVRREIQKKLSGKYVIRTWMELNRSLFSALKLEKIIMSIVLMLIILVAAFNIFSTLMLTTMEKAKDIAILQSIGAKRKSILAIFLYEGVVIGVIGIITGIIIGVALTLFIQHSNIIKLPPEIYYITKVPAKIKFIDLVLISSAAFVITLLSSLYPARKSSMVNPSEALRYE